MFFEKLLFRLNILWGGFTLLSLLSPYISPSLFWPVSIAGLLFPLFYVGNVLAVVTWLVFNWKKAWLSLLILLISMPRVGLFYGMHLGDKGFDGVSGITVTSHNLFGLKMVKHLFDTQSRTAVHKLGVLVKDLNRSDILCLQEVNPYSLRLLNRYLNFPFQHQYGKQGALLLSKHQYIDKGSIPFSNQTNSCVWADIKVESDTVRVYCLHLQSNRVSKTAESIHEEDLGESRTWRRVLSMFARYKNYSQFRAEEVKKVRTAVDASPIPVLIAGDFNDQPLSYAYHILSEDMQDAFVVKGRGAGSTYRGALPILRIDYILADTHYVVRKMKLIPSEVSDHNMVQANVALKRAP